MNNLVNIKKFDFLIEKPFTIFEKKNFLPEALYDSLGQEFPSESYFRSKHSLGTKKYFNNKDDQFKLFLDNSKTWKEFYENFNSEKTLKNIFEICKDHLRFIDRRKKINSIDFQYKVRKNFVSKLIRKIKQIFGIYEVTLAFEFSLMKNGDFIPPHNDTENKIVSLMIYFPDECQLKERDLGTNFFKIKSKNLDIWKGDMMDAKEASYFYQNYEIFYKSEFEKNKLVGFLKSNNSWHDVSIINSKTSLRRSLNINIYKI